MERVVARCCRRERRLVVAGDAEACVLIELAGERQGRRVLAPDADDDLEVALGEVGHGLARLVLDDDLDGIDLADVRGLDGPAERDAVRAEVLEDVGLDGANVGNGQHGRQGDGDAETAR